MKIAIIGGGNIGGAMALGMAESGLLDPSDVFVADKFPQGLDRIKSVNSKITTTNDNKVAVEGADLIIVAIKPWLLEEVVAEIADYMDPAKQMLVSPVPNYSLEKLGEMVAKGRDVKPVVFRVVVNTAASQKHSVNSLAGSANASEEQIKLVTSLYNSIGPTFYFKEEMLVPAFSLTSCAIAFAFKYLADSMAAGQEQGFSEEVAREMVIGTMEGALAVLANHKSMPADEIKVVTTPNGITLKGLEAMDKANFTEAVFEGVRRSR